MCKVICIFVYMKEAQAINPANLMTVIDFAEKEKITRQTVYNWIKEKKVKQVKFLGKSFIDKSTKK